MALIIRPVPTLEGDEAQRFIKAAEKAYKNRHTVDMSKYRDEYKKILKKAKI